MMNLLAADLDHVLEHTRPLWEELRSQRILITGGTGFFGCWLLESVAWVADRLELDCAAVVLTRRADVFCRKAPHLASHRAIQLLEGDVRTFPFPKGEFSHIIHAATESSTGLDAANPLLMLDTLTEGTRRVLDFARESGAKKLLLTSSGAVYGRQPPAMTRLAEEYPGGPDVSEPRSVYGEGKRAAEMLCTLYAREYGVEPKIARCFAFVGPYLPLGAHFAIGNFIRDGLRGGPIQVNGDGSPWRSYLYAADLVIWLWTILMRGQSCRPYNVGSENPLTIREVAEGVAGSFRPALNVHVARPPDPGKPAERYVPQTNRAREELGLRQEIGLPEAVARTIQWHQQMEQAHSRG